MEGTMTEYTEKFEEQMLDLMGMVDNEIKTEREIASIAVDELRLDSQMVMDWLDDYHLDDFMRY